MKEALSVLLLVVLFLSSSFPVLAQKGRQPHQPNQPTTKNPKANKGERATKFASAEAYTDGNGVLIKWQMDDEVDNAGFNLYRINSQGRTLVQDKFTPGALTRNPNGNAFGLKYRTFDPEGTADDTYEIESVTTIVQPGTSIKVSTTSVDNLSDVSGNSSSFFQSKSSPESFSITSTAQALPYDLNAEVSTYQATPNPTTQKFVASQAGVKIGVKNTGFYRVTRAELQNAGFDVSSGPNLWQLYTDGNEQAITIGGNGDYIEFYGKSINTPESSTRFYYLLVGSGPGKRIVSRLSRAGFSTVVSPAYDQTFVQTEKTWFIPQLSNGDAENYWGRFVNSTGTTMTLNLSGVPTSGNVVINYSALGFSDTAPGTSHTVNLTLNGTFIGALTNFTNISEKNVQLTVPASLIHDGANSLLMQTATSSDLCFFDIVSIQFPRKYLASQNQLSFHTENFKIANLDGFTSPNIRVFDTTIDGTPVLVNNLAALQNGPTYGVSMPAAAGRVFFAVEDSALQTAASVAPNLPSTLSTPGHNATLVIISYPDFANLPNDPTCLVGSPNYPGCLPPAQQWAVYRQGQGTSTEVVRADDIYDEFNYGVKDHNAIESFLNYAKNNWTTPPQYVLLMGDGSNDPKNYLGNGDLNYIPTKSVNSFLEEIDSDDAMADFNNDGVAELAVGRIPARQAANILDVLHKVEVFENYDALGQPKAGTAQSLASLGTLWAYDNGSPEGTNGVCGNDFFYDLSTTLAGNITSSSVSKTYISRLAPPAAVKTCPSYPYVVDPLNSGNSISTFISQVNAGKYFVNYSGHGSTSVMGYTTQRLFANCYLTNSCGSPNNPLPSPAAGTPVLTNSTKPMVFVSLSCLNGYFTDPLLGNISLSELLLSLTSGNLLITPGSNTSGGAVAAWASTAETTPFPQQAMGSRFYKQVALGTLPGKADPRLGDYIVDAKASIIGADVRASWVLLGDPMLKLKAQ